MNSNTKKKIEITITPEAARELKITKTSNAWYCQRCERWVPNYIKEEFHEGVHAFLASKPMKNSNVLKQFITDFSHNSFHLYGKANVDLLANYFEKSLASQRKELRDRIHDYLKKSLWSEKDLERLDKYILADSDYSVTIKVDMGKTEPKVPKYHNHVKYMNGDEECITCMTKELLPVTSPGRVTGHQEKGGVYEQEEGKENQEG